MVDRAFSEDSLAELYDLVNPRRPGDDFHLELIMSADSVLDVGCGTGTLLHKAREAGHSGHPCGLDPARAMLDQARKRSDVDWLLGDLSTAPPDRSFDLVVMTGHAFQELTEDGELREALGAVRSLLAESGRFVFETRNPAARAWERWTPEHAVEIVDADGATVRVQHDVERPVVNDIVRFTETYTGSRWGRPQVCESRLRFLDAEALATFLSGAGLGIEAQYGDWTRAPLTDTSPEIITIAARAPRPVPG